MRIVANIIGILALVPMVWLAFSFSDLSIGLQFIYTSAVCGVAGLACLYFWQSEGLLATIDFRSVGFMIGGNALLILGFLVIDAMLASVNPFKPEEWANLWKSGGMFGFTTTIGIAALLAMISIATVVRIVVLRVYAALTLGGTDGS